MSDNAIILAVDGSVTSCASVTPRAPCVGSSKSRHLARSKSRGLLGTRPFPRVAKVLRIALTAIGACGHCSDCSNFGDWTYSVPLPPKIRSIPRFCA